MIEAGLQKLITSNPDFSRLASGRIYPVLLPENSKFPSATYQTVGGVPLYVLAGRSGFTSMRLQVDTWAKSYAESKALAAAIVGSLDNFSGVLSDGTKVDGIQVSNTYDLYESAALLYRVFIEFAIQFAG